MQANENPISSLTMIKSPNTYKLVVTKPLEEKIRFLCNKLSNTEYSGTLFYRTTGSFKDNNIEFICVDFFLQDIGNSTYTEFENDVDLATYVIDHELIDCYTGLMHSHHTMATFFSGTDQSTLQQEGASRVHFLSLIVNNDGKYTARVTRKITKHVTSTINTDFITYNGQFIENNENKVIVEDCEELEYYDLDIEVESLYNDISELSDRFNEVKQLKENIRKNTVSTTYNEPKYIQPSLFDEYKAVEIEDVPSYDKVTDKIVTNIVKVLITMDTFSIYKSSVDIDKWVMNMEKLYNKRFSDKDQFDSYAQSFIEVCIHDDTLLEHHNIEEDVIATAVLDKLESLKVSNKYLDIYKKNLSFWV